MRYGEYDEYGTYGRRGRSRDSRGRYNEGGRGGSYGHYPYMMDRMDRMKDYYMDYNEGREQYNRGDSYNGEETMIEATEGIMKGFSDIVKELADSNNPEVMKVIEKHTRKIMEMM